MRDIVPVAFVFMRLFVCRTHLHELHGDFRAVAIKPPRALLHLHRHVVQEAGRKAGYRVNDSAQKAAAGSKSTCGCPGLMATKRMYM